MNAKNSKKRLKAIRAKLRRGDMKRIAELAEVHPVWVSYVLGGRGTSEKVLLIAERLINGDFCENDLADPTA